MKRPSSEQTTDKSKSDQLAPFAFYGDFFMFAEHEIFISNCGGKHVRLYLDKVHVLSMDFCFRAEHFSCFFLRFAVYSVLTVGRCRFHLQSYITRRFLYA